MRVGRRQRAAEVREHLGEHRDDEHQHEDAGAAGHGQHDDRVGHGALHLALQGVGLLQEDGQPAQDHVQDAARLAGGDHVRIQVGEHARVLLQGLGQRRAALDVGRHLHHHFLEVGLVELAAQHVQALHQRQAGVDHGRELAREDREVLDADALLLEEPAHGRGLRLLADRRDDDTPLAQVFVHRVLVGRFEFTGQDFALGGLALPQKHGRRTHGSLPFSTSAGRPVRPASATARPRRCCG